ncbi:hypothetical protein MF069_18975 [Paenibacillus mucilaginosus]|nr:hypothetical protein [Paenibacillus mucilaginosus]MCG7214883.1 hypothetical protein [Paenibacillus mucilaginosus]
MYYVGLGDYRLNIERVAARVRNGGHHIDSKDIIRREQTSLSNLLAHLQLIDHLIVIDNSSSDGQIVLETDSTTVKCYSKALPGWAETIYRHLQNRSNDQE